MVGDALKIALAGVAAKVKVVVLEIANSPRRSRPP